MDVHDRDARVFIHPRRLAGMAIFIALCIVVLSVRLYDLQVVNGMSYRALSEQNRVLRLPVTADRGFIVDRNGVVLVRNTPGFAVMVLPVDVPRAEQIPLAERLGALLGREGQEVLDAIGDLSVLGYPLIGSYVAHKSGHAINNKLLRALVAEKAAFELVTFDDNEQAPAAFRYQTESA